MDSIDKTAVAAHLHVLLRRHLGRVTDVEWMLTHADYAQALVALARGSGVAELQPWADKLAALVPAMQPPAAPAPPAALPAAPAPAPRYLRSLR